jgi:Cu/Ag efflux pump CusA
MTVAAFNAYPLASRDRLEVMQRIRVAVIGVVSSTVLTLIIIPAI